MEDWTDANSKSLPADLFWNDGCEVRIATDYEGHCMGIEIYIWEGAKADSLDIYIVCVIQNITIILIYAKVRPHIRVVHTSVGSGGQRGVFYALDYRKFKNGDAGKLANYPILLVLQDKFARFLFELHAFRFESVNLLSLPADQLESNLMCTEHLMLIRYDTT